jgi:cytochrome c
MKLRLGPALVSAGSLLLGAALGGGSVHPFGPLRNSGGAPLFSGTEIDNVAIEAISRACANCHSEKVEWPWYSRLAPVSWMIEADVYQAREHLNMSQWSRYTRQDRVTLLSAIAAVMRSKAMPPDRYTALHRESVLTDSERDRIYQWAKRERHRLLLPAEQPN